MQTCIKDKRKDITGTISYNVNGLRKEKSYQRTSKNRVTNTYALTYAEATPKMVRSERLIRRRADEERIFKTEHLSRTSRRETYTVRKGGEEKTCELEASSLW